MTVATEVTSTYAAGIAAKAPLTFSGHIDAALLLMSAVTVSANGNSSPALDVEGGDVEATWEIAIGTVTGASFTFLESLQCSIDGGSTYYILMTMPVMDIGDANKQIARQVYIPRPASGQRVVKLRVNHVITNTTSAVLTEFLRDRVGGMMLGLEYLT